jgi:ATP-dependent 26S proteasome regulatory subunit
MIYGNPGTGKTLIAVYFTSVQQLLTKHVGKSYRIRETQNMFKKNRNCQTSYIPSLSRLILR